MLALVLIVVVSACGSGDGERADGRPGPAAGEPTTTARARAAPSSTDPPTTSTTAPTTTAPSTTTSTTTTSTTTTTTPPAPEVEAGDLQVGVEGLRTTALQRRLHELAFDPGPVDGQFGTKTAQAVWAWQALAGVPRDGVVTRPLYDLIMAGPAPGMLRPDAGPTHTEVDLDKQVLLLFERGRLELVTHVSTGTGERYCEEGRCGVAVTPPGSYRYFRRVDGWRRAPLGELYNPIYFNGGIAVHGAPSVPAEPASHGCVRIPMHVAERFPALVADGERVVVFGGGPSAGPASDPLAGA